MNLLCRLGIAERHCGHVLQYGHFHSAVTAIQQGHQWPWVHGTIEDRGSDTCIVKKKDSNS